MVARFPRIRGDVPLARSSPARVARFSPHTRGCSLVHNAYWIMAEVFPAYAGMFPIPTPEQSPLTVFSPHTRGCSLSGLNGVMDRIVFPAYAGMFRSNLGYWYPR